MTNKMVETMFALRSSMEADLCVLRGEDTVSSKLQGHIPGHAAPPSGVPCAADRADRGRGQGAGGDQV